MTGLDRRHSVGGVTVSDDDTIVITDHNHCGHGGGIVTISVSNIKDVVTILTHCLILSCSEEGSGAVEISESSKISKC